jgi:hypothetical protein
MTDSLLLRNTKGIIITPAGHVFIAHFGQNGIATFPYIDCDEDKFVIEE